MDYTNLKIRILQAFNNANLIIKDNFSFIYLNSERQSEINKYDLGKGTFASAISLFALLNLLSKIYKILKNGDKNITKQQDIDEYENLKRIIKEKNPSEWNRIKKYFKKPRIGEINETDAFAELIIDTNIQFGLNKEKPEEIKKIWNLFRNKLTHLISLKGSGLDGQMLIQTNISGGTYLDNLAFFKRRYPKYPVFDIVETETKEKFKNNPLIDDYFKQYIVKDSCYVDQLKICSELILNWLIKEIESDKFSYQNMDILSSWLETELNC